MGYTRQEIIKRCEDEMANPSTFYKAPFVNYHGKTTDTNELYNEIVAEFICNHLTEFVGGIRKITREETYKTKSHINLFLSHQKQILFAEFPIQIPIKIWKLSSYEITTPSMERITIETEVVFSENYYRQVPRDRVFGGSGYRTVNYTPQCQKRDVLAWSRVSDSTGKGFNILLLKAEGSLYGDWFVLTNTNSVFNRNPRPEPFGFPLSELPKEIVNINVTHIYDLKLSELNEAKLIDFFAEHV